MGIGAAARTYWHSNHDRVPVAVGRDRRDRPVPLPTCHWGLPQTAYSGGCRINCYLGQGLGTGLDEMLALVECCSAARPIGPSATGMSPTMK